MSPASGYNDNRGPIVTTTIGGTDEPLSANELRLAQANQAAGLNRLIADQGILAAQIGGANVQMLIQNAQRLADALAEALAAAERLEAAAPPLAVPAAELLAGPQQALALGQSIPIVIARRRDDRGGVLVFPPATEAAFETNPAGFWGAYHCVLSQGEIPLAAHWQIRQGNCRSGRFSQAYDRRTGSWAPGNRAVQVASEAWQEVGFELPDLPTQCGGGGDYRGLSTIEFSDYYAPGFPGWNRAWNIFLESGMIIQRGRIIDDVIGPTDNIVDVWLFWRQQNKRIPDDLIDFPSLLRAAKFIEQYELRCNTVFSADVNFSEDILPWFLLEERSIDGRLGLVPMLRTDENGIVSEDPINPDWTISDDEDGVLISASMESPDFKTLEDQPIIVIWRQQGSGGDPQATRKVPLNRTLFCSSTGVGLEDPNSNPALATIDLSAWCDNEQHAARIGAFYHAKKLLQRYFGNITLCPGTHTGRMTKGNIVQLTFIIRSDSEPDYEYNKFFIIENISYAPDGGETITLAHHPVDGGGRGLIEQAFLWASAPGEILPHPPAGDCDLPEAATDETIPPAETNPDLTPISEGGGGSTRPSDVPPGRGDVSGPQPPEEAPPGSPGGGEEIGRGRDKPPRKASSDNPRRLQTELTQPYMKISPGYDRFCSKGKVRKYAYEIREEHEQGGNVAWIPVVSWGTPLQTSFAYESNGVEYHTLEWVNENGTPANSTHYTYPPFLVRSTGVVCANDPANQEIPAPGYVSGPGDRLKDMAQNVLGDENRWPEIYLMNEFVLDPRYLMPGSLLQTPPA